MGADNWGICPKCKKAAYKKKAKEQEKVGAAYGKVTPEKYREMFEAASQPVELDQTLREDYEIGIGEGGEFSVSYRGHCRECGLSHAFKTQAVVVEMPEELQEM